MNAQEQEDAEDRIRGNWSRRIHRKLERLELEKQRALRELERHELDGQEERGAALKRFGFPSSYRAGNRQIYRDHAAFFDCWQAAEEEYRPYEFHEVLAGYFQDGESLESVVEIFALDDIEFEISALAWYCRVAGLTPPRPKRKPASQETRAKISESTRQAFRGRARGRHVPLAFRRKTRTLEEWAREYGLKYDTLRRRLKRCWPAEAAPTRPVPRRYPDD